MFCVNSRFRKNFKDKNGLFPHSNVFQTVFKCYVELSWRSYFQFSNVLPQGWIHCRHNKQRLVEKTNPLTLKSTSSLHNVFSVSLSVHTEPCFTLIKILKYLRHPRCLSDAAECRWSQTISVWADLCMSSLKCICVIEDKCSRMRRKCCCWTHKNTVHRNVS